jgi:hypothetical protein
MGDPETTDSNYWDEFFNYLFLLMYNPSQASIALMASHGAHEASRQVYPI